VQPRVQNAAGMAVNSLVLVLISRLQKEIEDEVLDQKNQDRDQRNMDRIGHDIAPVCFLLF
jgi:hypothetical protein